jgi:selenocysteine lyase/cysteine desulfurase
MTGTQSHEGIAGTLAAVEYLADLGRSGAVAESSLQRRGDVDGPRRAALLSAYRGIESYERGLLAELLAHLAAIPEIKIWGITDPARFEERVPTVCLTHRRFGAAEIARRLAAEGIFAWHGNYYALPLTEALNLEPAGAVRVGLLHYNTRGEVERLVECLRRL